MLATIADIIITAPALDLGFYSARNEWTVAGDRDMKLVPVGKKLLIYVVSLPRNIPYH